MKRNGFQQSAYHPHFQTSQTGRSGILRRNFVAGEFQEHVAARRMYILVHLILLSYNVGNNSSW